MKALFLDLDGTLLNDDRKVPEGNREALERMLAQGHKVIINTGRPLAGAVGLASELRLDRSGCYLASFNGGLIYDIQNEDIIYQEGLSYEAVRLVSQEAVRKAVHVQMYDEWKVLCEPRWEDEDLLWYCKRLGMEYRLIGEEEMTRVRPLKMSGIDRNDRQRLYEFGEYLNEAGAGVVDAFLSNDMLLEIVPCGRNKGSALKRLAKMLGVEEGGTVAAGDEANDIPMLREAAIGVAMCNGTKETREVADVVTTRDNNDCGVREIIERYIL